MVLLDPIFTKEVKCPNCGQPVIVRQRSSCEDPAGRCPNCNVVVAMLAMERFMVKNGVPGVYFDTMIITVNKSNDSQVSGVM